MESIKQTWRWRTSKRAHQLSIEEPLSLADHRLQRRRERRQVKLLIAQPLTDHPLIKLTLLLDIALRGAIGEDLNPNPLQVRSLRMKSATVTGEEHGDGA